MGSNLNTSCCCTTTPVEVGASPPFFSVRPDNNYARKVQALPTLSRLVAEAIQQQKKQKPLLAMDNEMGELLQPHYIMDKLAYFNGFWLNGMPHGFGRMYYDDRCYFQGHFLNGESNCEDGLYVYPDGSYYRGEIVNSAANGKGKLVIAGGLMEYTGQWVNDKPEGKGLQRFKDGSFYEGSFKNGLKHGNGVFHWANGTVYEGEFSNGRIEGYGTEKLPDGTIKTGVFRHGKIQHVSAAPDYYSKYAGNTFPIRLSSPPPHELKRLNSQGLSY